MHIIQYTQCKEWREGVTRQYGRQSLSESRHRLIKLVRNDFPIIIIRVINIIASFNIFNTIVIINIIATIIIINIVIILLPTDKKIETRNKDGKAR